MAEVKLSFIGLSEAVVNRAVAGDPTGCIRTFRYLLAPLDGTTAVILSAPLSARNLLFRSWQARLSELADHRLPSVREEVALAIRAWQDLARVYPGWGYAESLDTARLKLAKDPRARVRHATRPAADRGNQPGTSAE